MATSGSTSFNPSRDEIINGSLRLLGAYATGSSPRAEQVKEASQSLNLMLKAWRTDEGLWLREFQTLFLVPGQASYSMPGANATNDLTESALTVAGSALDTSINASTTGMDAADVVGIELDDGAIQWTTVSSVTDSATFVVSTALTGAAAIGNEVFYYPASSAIQRPTRVFDAYRRESGNDVPLFSIGRKDYMALTNKSNTGPVTQYYLDAQRETAKLYVWPTAELYTDKLVLDVDRQVEDMLNEGNTYDVPQEWLECIKYGLAWRLSGEYGLSSTERTDLRNEYMVLKNQIKSSNIEATSIFMQPNFQGRRG